MKSFYFLIAVLLVGVNCDVFVPGRSTGSRISGRKVLTIAEVCTDASKTGKSYCGSDLTPPCDAAQVFSCTGVGKGLTFDCQGAVPFCASSTPGKASCSNVRDENCAPPASDFECTGKGFFPDPFNCKLFYQCSDDGEGGLIADQYECDDQYVFDPSAPKGDYCRLTRNKFCTVAKCDGTSKNILLKYQFLPKSKGQIVASCRKDGKTPYVFRCDEGFVANLNTLPVQCDLVCNRADKKAYAGDSTKYYECVFNGLRWESKVKSCYRDFYFDAKSKKCVVNPTPAPPTKSTTSSEATTGDSATSAPSDTTLSADTTLGTESTGNSDVTGTTIAATTIAATTGNVPAIPTVP